MGTRYDLGLVGSLAGATATAATYPLDLVRSRMAGQWGSYTVYPTITRAAYKIFKEEGGRALVQGMRPTLLGIVPYAGLSFMVFETLKSRIQRDRSTRTGEAVTDADIPVALRLLAGGVAGLVAQSATYPLDIVRRRMQVGVGLFLSCSVDKE